MTCSSGRHRSWILLLKHGFSGKPGHQRVVGDRQLSGPSAFVSPLQLLGDVSVPWRVNPGRSARFCRGVGWGVEGKQVGSMNEEPQVRGCYNITFICTPTNRETVSLLEKTQANKTFRT